jgi:hypothetical protein
MIWGLTYVHGGGFVCILGSRKSEQTVASVQCNVFYYIIKIGISIS